MSPQSGRVHDDEQNIRHFIQQRFNDSELRDFCLAYFPQVHDEFTIGMNRSQMVRELVDYCHRHERVPDLMAALQRDRPQQFQQYFSWQTQQTTPAPKPYTTQQRNPKQIFLSHAHQDADFAQRLAQDLRADGWTVWIAPDSIRPGEKWVEAINRGLEESGVFVLVLTEAAVHSRWVRTETTIAIEMEHEQELRLIPVQVAAARTPAVWRAYQHIPFSNGYDSGLVQLLNWLVVAPAAATPSPPPLPTIAVVKPDRRIHQKTGIELIRIPAGSFLYGSADNDKLAHDNEKPQHRIELPEYWIGRTLVTNVQYKRFLDANSKQEIPYVDADWAKPYNWDRKRRTYPSDKGDHPVVLVSWHDAQAFCKWAGLQLPLEEEWEKGARGTAGRLWPWGNNPPTADLCNFNNNVGSTTAVGKYSPQGDSPYGCADMAGNVWEWTASPYSEDSSTYALRGGAWVNVDQLTRAAFRLNVNPHLRYNYVGFRVAEHLSYSAS